MKALPISAHLAALVSVTFTLVLEAPPASAQHANSNDAERFATARAHVLPDDKDQRWLSVPWRLGLAEAALEADRVDKPVVLWTMNGHPLGCT